MGTLLNASNKDVFRSDLTTAITLLDQNAIVSDALGQRFLQDKMEQYHKKRLLTISDKQRQFESTNFSTY